MLRRTLLFLALLGLLVSPASATWSIVVVNRRTGEVAVGGATCIARFNLLNAIPAVSTGRGAGVIQASGDNGDLVPMTQGLRAGLDPADILLLVQAAEPSLNQLQTGIVSLYPGAPVTFTGGAVGNAKHGVVGEVGDLAYAIQGNVLTGDPVVIAAEQALLDTPGDLGQKLLAAMQAARGLGGDGRCSCSLSRPTSCGVPPADFDKSAHCGFMVIARMGDPDSPCLVGGDCADGAYYMKLNVRGGDAAETAPDPVDQLSDKYVLWRAARSGRPDGILSTVEAVDSLPADGRTKRLVTVRLVDLDGVPLDHGGADVRVTSLGGARANLAVSPVADHGDGSYSFSLGAGTRVGLDRFAITAEDDLIQATLFPFLEVRSEAPTALHVGVDALSASVGGSAPFVLVPRGAAPGAFFALLASGGGTAPGQRLPGGVVLPLNRDPWFFAAARSAALHGVLDATGRAELEVAVPPGALVPLIGARLDWAAIVGGTSVTAPVGFAVTP